MDRSTNRLKTLQQSVLSLASQSTITIVNEEIIDGKTMQADIQQAITQINKIKENKIALYFDNSYYFAVALLAIFYCNKTPVLLPNAKPEFIKSIESEISHIFSDLILEPTNITTSQIIADKKLTPAAATIDFPDNDLELILFTSGSTGQPKKIIKKLYQLESEFRILEQLWGESIGDAIIRSTVSHQHIYGLIFRLLWPLCSGRCFDATTYQYPEKMLEKILQSADNILISSPAHLKRIPELIDFNQAKNKIHRVFSSGGPLDTPSALKLSSLLDFPVTEVFGSSETGGIAHRQQTDNRHSQSWTVFSEIEIKQNSEDNTLIIKSPFEGSGDWYSTSDIISLDIKNNRFEHLGRTDKIVKIEEKRLSLTELENQLKTHPFISDCASTVLDGKRSILAIVATLNNKGDDFLKSNNKRILNGTLKKHLGQYFEAVVLPRKWRYVSQIPTNPQGKTTQQDLKKIFTDTDSNSNSNSNSPTKPAIDKINKTGENKIELSLNILENLYYFNGHFPDNPVLPGVIQIDWAIKFAKEYLNVTGDFKGMEVIKFYNFIVPNELVTLTLSYKKDSNKLNYSFKSSHAKFSSGRIILG